MIYSLETIPMVLFSKIIENGDLTLLSDENLPDKELQEVWDKIKEDYKEHDGGLITKKVDSLKHKLDKDVRIYKLVLLSLEALKYGKDKDILKVLKSNGYTIGDDFKAGLALVNKQVLNLEATIERTKNEILNLLKGNDKKTSIYESIISISVGLKIPIETNKITAIEFIYYKKALANKIKSLRNGK